MQSRTLIVPVVIAAILIAFGRVNRRSWWGNWVAVAGYAVLAVTIVVALATGA